MPHLSLRPQKGSGVRRRHPELFWLERQHQHVVHLAWEASTARGGPWRSSSIL